jgi:hypothetical protein
MNIPDSVKNKYKSTSVTKNVVVQFPNINLTVAGENIYADSLQLTEKLCDSDSIEFVGCISSKFEIDIRDLGQNVKGQYVYVYIYAGDDSSEAIPLFHGIVDEVKMQSNHRIKHIVAYDELYTKGNKDVSAWYKGLSFGSTGISLGRVRRTLLGTMGLQYEDKTLPNDDIKIKKQYNPSSLQALAVLKSICQINGVFGMIDRTGVFKFIILPQITPTEGTFPGVTLFPPFYPSITSGGSGGQTDEGISHYRDLSYQEFSVKPVDKITIRQSGEDDGASYGSGNNNYIIQGNMFTLGLKESQLRNMAQNIYPNVQGFSYIPYDLRSDGFPWIECGQFTVDCMVYDFNNSTASTDIYQEKHFHILSRNLSGIQNLKDEYNANGDEYQREFISDVGLSIDVVQKNVQNNVQKYVDERFDDYYDKDEIDDKFNEFEPTGGWSVESVATLPAQGEDNVLYLIQGEVVVE